MTDLISTPPAPASPPNSKVEMGGWWPDIDINGVRAALNMGGTTIAHDRLVAAITHGAVEATNELADWKAAQIAAGIERLDQVGSAETIGGASMPVTYFLRAVTMFAAAELADRNLDITATRDGTVRAETRVSMADDFRRSAVRAIRMILGVPGTMVDLV